jgi:hypothetical protein
VKLPRAALKVLAFLCAAPEGATIVASAKHLAEEAQVARETWSRMTKPLAAEGYVLVEGAGAFEARAYTVTAKGRLAAASPIPCDGPPPRVTEAHTSDRGVTGHVTDRVTSHTESTGGAGGRVSRSLPENSKKRRLTEEVTDDEGDDDDDARMLRVTVGSRVVATCDLRVIGHTGTSHGEALAALRSWLSSVFAHRDVKPSDPRSQEVRPCESPSPAPAVTPRPSTTATAAAPAPSRAAAAPASPSVLRPAADPASVPSTAPTSVTPSPSSAPRENAPRPSPTSRSSRSTDLPGPLLDLLQALEDKAPTIGRPLPKRAAIYQDDRLEHVLSKAILSDAEGRADNPTAKVWHWLSTGLELSPGPTTLTEARAELIERGLKAPSWARAVLDALAPPDRAPSVAAPSSEELLARARQDNALGELKALARRDEEAAEAIESEARDRADDELAARGLTAAATKAGTEAFRRHLADVLDESRSSANARDGPTISTIKQGDGSHDSTKMARRKRLARS